MKTKTIEMIPLFDKFIKNSQAGRRLKKNGSKVNHSSIKNYFHVRKLLIDFSSQNNFTLRIKAFNKLSKRELNSEKKYWKAFYQKFTDYLFNDLHYIDNTVGTNIKIIRTFFNYLNDDLLFNCGTFHKKFYVTKEDIDIVTLSPEQLNFLIRDIDFENGLDEKLKIIKDIFVFGCTVGLRVSDLLILTKLNIHNVNEAIYLKTYSKKTNTKTIIKLPEYCIQILNRYESKYSTLLPKINNVYLNLGIKELMEKASWTYPYLKLRRRRGIPHQYDKILKQHRFCDVITSHTMRRTAISTMLTLGMPEQYVRKISGHTAGSKEFFRYVAEAQNYIDKETDKVFDKLNNKIYHVNPL